jgi:hypothetical protein
MPHDSLPLLGIYNSEHDGTGLDILTFSEPNSYASQPNDRHVALNHITQ